MKLKIITGLVLSAVVSSVFFVHPVEAKTLPKLKPTALCKDGTYSYSQTRKGTCSHHKGVKYWYR